VLGVDGEKNNPVISKRRVIAAVAATTTIVADAFFMNRTHYIEDLNIKSIRSARYGVISESKSQNLLPVWKVP
jgi:hypothetical protein